MDDMLLPDMPIAFDTEDWPARDEDVGGGPYFGYCNVPKLYTNLPFPDLAATEPLSCGEGCMPFTETDRQKEQAVFLGRPTGQYKHNLQAKAQISPVCSAVQGHGSCSTDFHSGAQHLQALYANALRELYEVHTRLCP